jgi:hypothetical protein
LNLLAQFTKPFKQWSPDNDLKNIAYTGYWFFGTTPVPYNNQPAQISQDG